MVVQNRIAEQVFGTIGTICWTGQLIPQIWKSWRTRSTTGLSHWLVLLWGISSVFQGVYNVVQRINIPLMIQPQLFGFLSLVSWGQCQYYERHWTRRKSILVTLLVMLACGSIETAVVLSTQASHSRGSRRAVNAFGILSSILVSAGLLPQYWEIYRRREVMGISMVFISIDILGGIFNDLSLAFKEKFDVIAALTYTAVIILDGLVVLAAIILNPIARRRRLREAEQNGQVHDDIVRDASTQNHDLEIGMESRGKVEKSEGSLPTTVAGTPLTSRSSSKTRSPSMDERKVEHSIEQIEAKGEPLGPLNEDEKKEEVIQGTLNELATLGIYDDLGANDIPQNTVTAHKAEDIAIVK